MTSHSAKLIEDCRKLLIEARTALLNRMQVRRRFMSTQEGGGGDEADQSMRLLSENNWLAEQSLARSQMVEIDSALARIEQGIYGRCEETDELIEAQRLLAIPWTRLSIEGAEMREARIKRFAR